jgi:hypothetical protein
MAEELIPGFSLGQHRMYKTRKVKGGPPSKDLDQTSARIERKEETTPRIIKSSIREKKGAERLTTHPHDLFLG